MLYVMEYINVMNQYQDSAWLIRKIN